MSPPWTHDEKALVLYYRCRGISIQGCKEALDIKKRTKEVDELEIRSLFSIAYALRLLQGIEGIYDKDSRSWDVERCDAAINSWPINDLNQLVQLHEGDIEKMPDIEREEFLAFFENQQSFEDTQE